MIKNIKMKNSIFLGVIILALVIVINISKNEINKATHIAKKDVETEIQAIIDSVKQEKENENSMETENVVATIED